MIGSFWWKCRVPWVECVFSSRWFRHQCAWQTAGLDKFRAVIVRQSREKTERLMSELKTKLQKWEQRSAQSYVIVQNRSRLWWPLLKNFRMLVENVCLLEKSDLENASETWGEVSRSCGAAQSSETRPAHSLFYSRLTKPLQSSPLPPKERLPASWWWGPPTQLWLPSRKVFIWAEFLGASLVLLSVDQAWQIRSIQRHESPLLR